ncbi:MAG: hypothetical protein QXE93_01430 [Candidatus Pacearchaeota archaeon]
MKILAISDLPNPEQDLLECLKENLEKNQEKLDVVLVGGILNPYSLYRTNRESSKIIKIKRIVEEKLAEKAESLDQIVREVATQGGFFTKFENSDEFHEAKEIIEELEKRMEDYYKKAKKSLDALGIRYFIIPGIDNPEMLEKYFPEQLIHKKVVEIDQPQKLMIAGYGGVYLFPNIYLPFRICVQKEEAEQREDGIYLHKADSFDFFVSLEEKGQEPDVVFSYWPPFGINDKVKNENYGSFGLRASLDKIKPDLWIACCTLGNEKNINAIPIAIDRYKSYDLVVSSGSLSPLYERFPGNFVVVELTEESKKANFFEINFDGKYDIRKKKEVSLENGVLTTKEFLTSE